MKPKTILTILILTLPLAQGHLASGEDITKNGYIIDFGYEPENPRAGDQVKINVNLVNATTEKAIVLDNVWMRTSKNNTITDTGNYNPNVNNVITTQTFAEPGTYEITIRFEKNQTTLVEHDFQLKIQPLNQQETLGPEKAGEGLLEEYSIGAWFLIGQIILLMIAIIAYITIQKTSRSKD